MWKHGHLKNKMKNLTNYSLILQSFKGQENAIQFLQRFYSDGDVHFIYMRIILVRAGIIECIFIG